MHAVGVRERILPKKTVTRQERCYRSFSHGLIQVVSHPSRSVTFCRQAAPEMIWLLEKWVDTIDVAERIWE